MANEFLQHQYVILLLIAIVINFYAKTTRNRILVYLLFLPLSLAFSMLFSSFLEKNKFYSYILKIVFSSIYYGPILYLYLLSIYKTNINFKLVSKHFTLPFLLTLLLIVFSTIFDIPHPILISLIILRETIPFVYAYLGIQFIKNHKNNSIYVAKKRFIMFYGVANLYIITASLILIVSMLGYTGIEPLINIAMTLPKFYYDVFMYPLWILFCLVLSVYTISESWWVKKFIIKETLELNKDLNNNKINDLFKIIEDDLITTKRYLQSNLDSKTYSKILNIDIELINSFVSQKNFKSFTQLLNFYRVEEFKRKVSSDKNTSYTLMGIATDCGFKSKSTFFRIFKEFENKTPKAFVDTLKS